MFDGKSTPLYRAAWKKIIDLLPGFHPEFAHADFEGPQQLAFEEETGSKVNNCRFHYSTSTFRNMQKLGLSHLYKENPEFRLWMLRIMAIPLLRHDYIKEAFKVLLRKQIPNLNKTDKLNFAKFRRYMQRQWARKTKPQNLSVYGLDQQTNNGAESFHAWLKAVIKTHCPNFWTFCYHLNRYDL